jgi:hypothetical protein
MRFTILSLIILSIAFSLSGQGIMDLYPSMPKDSLILSLKSNGFKITKDDSKTKIVEFQKITKEGKLDVKAKFNSLLQANNIQINFPKIPNWSKLKMNYDKLVDSLTGDYGKPTKVISINPIKKGTELSDLVSGKIRMLHSFLDNFVMVEITKNQSIQIQFENIDFSERIKVEDISVIIGKTKEISVGKPIVTIPECSDSGGFTEDFDANFKVAILETYTCGDKKYYIIESKGKKVMINARYIKIDNDLNFDEVSNITQNLKYKRAVELYTEDLNDNEKKEFQSYIKQQQAVGIILLDYSVEDVSEVTDGVTAKFEVFNPTNKTIKYVTFYVSGINPVGDAVYNVRQHSNISEFRGVGPIKPNESANYEWEYAWFTDVVETLKIKKVKIQYMDGSTKIVTNTKSLILPSGFEFQLSQFEEKMKK